MRVTCVSLRASLTMRPDIRNVRRRWEEEVRLPFVGCVNVISRSSTGSWGYIPFEADCDLSLMTSFERLTIVTSPRADLLPQGSFSSARHRGIVTEKLNTSAHGCVYSVVIPVRPRTVVCVMGVRKLRGKSCVLRHGKFTSKSKITPEWHGIQYYVCSNEKVREESNDTIHKLLQSILLRYH